jgi:hypothetical protein
MSTSRTPLATARRLRLLLLAEAAVFAVAASVHFGAFLDGYDHRKAGIAETVITVVLLLGLLATWSGTAESASAAIAAQVFAILGVCVGLFTIAVGVGPRTVLDVVYHVTLLAGLILGLRSSSRWPRGATRPAGR